MKLSVIIPAYNEEAVIETTLIAVAAYLDDHVPDSEIIIVNDGSTDKTQSIIDHYRMSHPHVNVITHHTNCGKGAAVKTGIRAAQGEQILFMDADSSTSIHELTQAWPFLDQADIVIGSRYISGAHIVHHQSRWRIIISRFANQGIRLFLLPGIYDTQCGFKLFRKEIAMDIVSVQQVHGWMFDTEQLVIARSRGYTIKELPIAWQDSTKRPSRFRASHSAMHTISDLIRIYINQKKGTYLSKKK